MMQGTCETRGGLWSHGGVLGFFVVLALVVALLLPGASSSAPLSELHCGDTVTTNVVLTRDFVCPGDGLYLQASSNITLDMHGHSIRGSGSGAGLSVLQSSADIVVENGTLSGFGEGVFIDDYYPTLTLDHLAITDNGVGVATIYAGLTMLSNSSILRSRGDGVVTYPDNGDFRMVNDHVENNGGNGISANEDSFRLLANSVIAHNAGIGLYLSQTVATVGGNTFRANGSTGLFISETSCSIYLPYYLVSNNVANENLGGGMAAYCPPDTGAASVPGSGNAAKNNSLFQCIVIVCAENPGPANKAQSWLVAAPSITHHP